MVAILLFNVMEVFSVGEGALLDRPGMVFQEEEEEKEEEEEEEEEEGRRNKFIMTHDSYKILQHKNKQN